MSKAAETRRPALGVNDPTHSSTDRPGLAPDADELVMPGEIGHYEIRSLLGRGGMGAVYLAHDRRLGRQVALKVLPETNALEVEARRLLTQEAQAAAALNHPGICTIHGIEQHRGRLFLVLEYIPGTTFRELIDTSAHGWPPRAPVAVNYILQVAEALQAAHSAGIIHRDIKSANLMLTPDGRVKVLDFGVAKVTAGHSESGENVLIGTPSYLSPEQTRGDPVDARTDLWSLGVVFYEVLTAQKPFQGDNYSLLLDAILHEDPRPIRRVRPEISAALVRIIHKLLAKDREKRYASARALVQDLRPFSAPVTEQIGIGTQTRKTSVPGASTEMLTGVAVAERRAITFVSLQLIPQTNNVVTAPDRNLEDEARELCRNILESHEGVLQNWIGNRASAYFGYPRAREDAARLAVEAALGLAKAFERSMTGYSVKLAVETSLVITRGSEFDAAATISGEGIVVTEQLLEGAGLNQVVIGSETQRLVEGRFAVGEEMQLALVDGRVLRARQVLQQSTARSRFQAIPEAGLSPLAGRDQEVQLLLSRWRAAVDGYGNVTLLSGEAGLGKSRLTYELKRIVASDPSAALIECFCLSQYSNTALYPIVDCFERLIFESDTRLMSPVQKLKRVEGLLAELGFSLPQTVPLIARLLSVPARGYAALELTPERQRTLTLEALANIVAERASRQPLLFVVEDLHWADPTTLELLGMIIDQAPSVRALALFTHRPECELNWPQRSYVSTIALDRLSRSNSLAIARAVARGKNLASSTLEEIVDNSDGVPLFLEEMAKTVADTGLSFANGERLPVPASLRDSFIARLDQLGPARNIARMASVLGRQFTHGLLEAVAGTPEQDLRESLERLVEAEILHVRGAGDRRVYIFKHVLLQEAAYDSLIKETKEALHAEVAATLIGRFPETAEREPEVVARHLTLAGLGEQAIPYWHGAGLAALQRSAYPEALSLFNKGLEVHNSLPAEQKNTSQELMLVVSRGPALIATRGFGAEEVGATYQLAETLLSQAGDGALTLPTLWGVWVYHLVRSELSHAFDTTGQLIQKGEQSRDDAMHIEGLWTSGNTLYWRGDLTGAQERLEKAEALYNEESFREHAVRFGQDPLVATLCYLSFVYCFQGSFAEAVAASDRSIDHAKELRHPFSIGWSLAFRGMLDYFLEDFDEAGRRSEAAAEYCKQQRYPFWISAALSVCGRSLAEAGDAAKGIALLEEAVALTSAIGSRVVEPLYRGLLAEARLCSPNREQALADCESALELAGRYGVAISRFDLLRIRGRALAALGRLTDAEPALYEAMNESRAAGCRLVELKAAADLAQCCGDPRPLQTVLQNFLQRDKEPYVLRKAREILLSERI